MGSEMCIRDSVNQIKKVVPQLVKYGKVLRPKIGVYIEDTDYGPAIMFVDPGSPADKAGLEGSLRRLRYGSQIVTVTDLRSADFIIAVAGVEVKSKDDINSVLADVEPGKSVELLVRKGASRDELRKLRVTPELR